jgi:peptidoglycan/xylan/chitin deacetylase (PgdA/CDA1 family)
MRGSGEQQQEEERTDAHGGSGAAKIRPGTNFEAHSPKMREPLPHLLRRKAVETGLLPVGGAGRARVLMYHGIGADGCHQVNVRHLPQATLDRHLRLLNAHCHVVSLGALAAGERHPQKLTVALTFDDGLRNNLTHALPVLEAHRVPATFFITGAARNGLRILWGDLLDLSERHTTKLLQVDGRTWRPNAAGRYALNGTGPLLRDHIKAAGAWGPKQALYDQLGELVDGALSADRTYWELKNDADLRKLAQHPLCTLGSHGWWHNDMGRIPATEVREELQRSVAYLSDICGKAPASLAWPSGSWSPEGVRLAADLGFSIQLAVDPVPTEERHLPLIDRFGMYELPIRDRWLLRLMADGARR